jgi:hypothetical protein
MIINVCCDLYASTIECDNIEKFKFSKILHTFDEWLYEFAIEESGPCRRVKKSLNITVLDINAVIRFFNEIYPNSNPRIINCKFSITDMDDSIPVIPL